MTQLSYQAAFDPFHAVYRLVRLGTLMEKPNRMRNEMVRMLDFYLLFPFQTSAIRLMPNHRKYKRIAEKYEGMKPYGRQPDSRILFERIEPMQIAAQDTLASRGILSPELLKQGYIQFQPDAVPEELYERASQANKVDSELMEFLKVLASEYELLGPNGLKSRSGLMEYRYDAI